MEWDNFGQEKDSSDLVDKLRAQVSQHQAEVKRLLEKSHQQQLELLQSRCGELETSLIDSLCSKGGTVLWQKSSKVASNSASTEVSKKPKLNSVVPNAVHPSEISEKSSLDHAGSPGWASAPKKPASLDSQVLQKIPAEGKVTKEKPQGKIQPGDECNPKPHPITLNALDGTTILERLKSGVRSPACDTAVAAVILLNTIFMAFQTDWTARNLKEPQEGGWITIVGKAFTAFFTLDLLVRFMIERCEFFTGPTRNWNIFDLLVVGSALLEETLSYIVDQGPSVLSNTKVMRVLRILRLVRALRVLRAARFFRELRTLVYGILLSFSSLFWACILGSATIFVFSVYTTQGVSAFFINEIEDGEDPNITQETRDSLRACCSSLPITMYVHWKAISGGVNWGEVADPLFEISKIMGFVFTLYVIFSICAILNVVTGVFVNKALKIAEADMDTMMLESAQTRRSHQKKIEAAFKSADADFSGQIDAEEFAIHCQDEQFQAFFRYLELDLEGTDPHDLFEMLDFSGDGNLDIEEFCSGCCVLKGYARSIDLARHVFQHKQKYDALMDSNKELASLNGRQERLLLDFGDMHKELHDFVRQTLEKREQKAKEQPVSHTECTGNEGRADALEQQILQLQQCTSQVLELFQKIVEKANSREKRNQNPKVAKVEEQRHANIGNAVNSDAPKQLSYFEILPSPKQLS